MKSITSLLKCSGRASRKPALLVSSTLALDEMVTEKISEIKPDVIVSDSVAYWGKLIAKKLSIPYVSSTTTFAFNKHSARLIKHGAAELVKMLFSMPKINKQIKRLQKKGYPVKGIFDIIQNDNETDCIRRSTCLPIRLTRVALPKYPRAFKPAAAQKKPSNFCRRYV